MTSSWKVKLGILAGSQALSQSISVFIMTLSSWMGARLAPDPARATLPVAAIILGTLAGLFPASAFMARRGRRPGFLLGAGLGLGGAMVAMAGLATGSLAIFALGHFLMGLQQGAFQYLRFAAVDVVPSERKDQGIALVMAGGVVAAFAGPWLAHGGRSLGLAVPLGLAYGPLLALYVVLGLLLLGGGSLEAPDLPGAAPGPGVAIPRKPRPLLAIVGQGAYLQALLGSILGYTLMILLMTATPLAMGHDGHESHETSWVIQWHVLGMFVPSFFTGSLIKRLGHRPIIVLGFAALGADALAALLIPGLWGYWASLTLLGIGWNFLYIGSTSRLTGTYRPEEKGSAQAFHDIVVFAANTGATYGAAGLLGILGWDGLHRWLVPVVVAGAVVCLWPPRSRTRDGS